jgi:hypothetical protein
MTTDNFHGIDRLGAGNPGWVKTGALSVAEKAQGMKIPGYSTFLACVHIKTDV